MVLDCLGGEDLGVQLPLLNEGGRWIVIALLRGTKATVDLRSLLGRRLRLIGSTLRARPLAEKVVLLEALRREIWPLIDSGAVRPVIQTRLPIEEAEAAHGILQRNENVGKVLLVVSRDD